MKVVIANPPWPGEGYGTRSNIRWPHRRGDKVLTFPIYLAYAVAVLKKTGFKVWGIDAVDKEYSIGSFVREIAKINPEVILMEVSTPSINYDLEAAKKLRENTKSLIVFCGPHASYFHKDLIEKYPSVDVCIRGEFEHAIRDICIAVNKKKDLTGIAGITYRKGDKVIVNKERKPIENLDELPFPDRKEFKLGRYQQAFFGGKKTALVISSRGCPFMCTYCLWPNTLFGHKFRARSPKNVVDEIEALMKGGVDEIYFDDDTFTIDKKRVKEICIEFLNRKIKIPWLCMSRVDTIDQETLRLIKKAGCKEVFFGIESGSEEILKEMCKGITKKRIIETVRMAQKEGIITGGSFVVGMPNESKKTITETIRFAKRLHLDYVQFALAAPFPGTKFYETAKESGLLKIKSWEDFDGTKGAIVNTEYLTKKELSGIIRKMYIKYYTSPSVIWQNVKKARSVRDISRIIRGSRSVLSRIFYYKK